MKNKLINLLNILEEQNNINSIMRILIEHTEHKAQFADINVLLDFVHKKQEKIENKLDKIISNIIQNDNK